eukprot:1174356-Prorocentrum_minimum.AAC.3
MKCKSHRERLPGYTEPRRAFKYGIVGKSPGVAIYDRVENTSGRWHASQLRQAIVKVFFSPGRVTTRYVLLSLELSPEAHLLEDGRMNQEKQGFAPLVRGFTSSKNQTQNRPRLRFAPRDLRVFFFIDTSSASSSTKFMYSSKPCRPKP